MKIAFFDAKPYDRRWFDTFLPEYDFKIRYIESRLSPDSADLATGCEAACCFVNDRVTAEVTEALVQAGVKVLLLRCAGFNNVDLRATAGKLHVLRVPAYSPYAVAEYALALLLSVNRKTHRAYARTKEYNFSINGLEGRQLNGMTAGIIGTGKIGQITAELFKALGMKIIAYDPYPIPHAPFPYVSQDELFAQADVISLHCPLTESTEYIIGEDSISKMKDGVIIINTSRGGLVHTLALIEGLKNRKIGGVGLDVYEEEEEYFFEDRSDEIMEDESLVRLMSFPNVLVTSHQAFFTAEAMEAIAKTTLDNLLAYQNGEPLVNEVSAH